MGSRFHKRALRHGSLQKSAARLAQEQARAAAKATRAAERTKAARAMIAAQIQAAQAERLHAESIPKSPLARVMDHVSSVIDVNSLIGKEVSIQLDPTAVSPSPAAVATEERSTTPVDEGGINHG